MTILEFVDYQCPFTARAEPAEVKGEAVAHWAGLFLRVEGEGDRVITSQRTRLMPGDRGWHQAEVVVAIPADARAFSFGQILAGSGLAAMRKLTLEVLPAGQ